MAHSTDISKLAGTKRQRNSRACDRCHHQACKCTTTPGEKTCMSCIASGSACTYLRPSKRRGPISKRANTANNPSSNEEETSPPGRSSSSTAPSNVPPPPDWADPESDQRSVRSNGSTGPMARQSPAGSSSILPHPSKENPTSSLTDALLPPPPLLFGTSSTFKYEYVAADSDIYSLVEVFYQTAFPIRPYFHWPTFQTQVQRQLYKSDWAIYVVTCAVCYFASGRLRESATTAFSGHALYPRAGELTQLFYDATLKAVPTDLAALDDSLRYTLMKVKALLGSACLQLQDLRSAIVHFGDYLTLSALSQFHLETSWPADLTQRDIQERRRLYWALYQQEQYMSISFGTVARARESQARVEYPAEVYDDNDITETSINYRSKKLSFLCGFNYCSDIYRLTERFSRKVYDGGVDIDEPGGLVSQFLRRSEKALAIEASQLVSKMYDDLPDELRRAKPMSGEPQEDHKGFMSANVLISTQCLKMRLAENSKSSIQARCAIVGELLDELSTFPVEYLQASSITTLYHLVHLGSLLGNAVTNPLPAWTYLQIRNYLSVLADFILKMETNRGSARGISQQLRTQIGRLDDFISHASHESGSLLSMGKRLLPGYTEGSSTQASPKEANGDTFPPIIRTSTSHLVSSTSNTTLETPPLHQSLHQPDSLVDNSIDAGMLSLFPEMEERGDQGSELALPPELLEGWPFNWGLPDVYSDPSGVVFSLLDHPQV